MWCSRRLAMPQHVSPLREFEKQFTAEFDYRIEVFGAERRAPEGGGGVGGGGGGLDERPHTRIPYPRVPERRETRLPPRGRRPSPPGNRRGSWRRSPPTSCRSGATASSSPAPQGPADFFKHYEWYFYATNWNGFFCILFLLGPIMFSPD